MRNYFIIAATALVLLMASCSSAPYGTKGQAYAKLYQESPATIVVMPPINHTNISDARTSFYSALHKPLCEKGYYVFPPIATIGLMRGYPAFDSKAMLGGDASLIYQEIGADAALFTIIKKWDKDHLFSVIRVEVEYILKSTKTNAILYKREGLVTLDLEVYTGDDALSLIFDAVVSTINTELTDNIVAGRQCAYYVLSDLPAGKYSPNYQEDADEPAGQPYLKVVTME